MNDHGRFDPAPLGRRLLARSGRLARAGGARFAAQAIARHRNPTIGRRPRLMPVPDATPNDADGYAPLEATPLPRTPPVAQAAPVALPRPGGISEEAARWLFRGELGPNMLPMSAIKPAPSVARRPSRGAIPRARIEEGPSWSASSGGRPAEAAPRPEAVQAPSVGPVGDAGAERVTDAEASSGSMESGAGSVARVSRAVGDAEPGAGSRSSPPS